MKRTTLMLDEVILQKASSVLGAKTYSDTVNWALAEAVRNAEIRGLVDLFGTGIWSGDLSVMREDRGVSKPKTKNSKQRLEKPSAHKS